MTNDRDDLGHDTPTGTDPDARYDRPGYEDKSLGQAVEQDEDMVERLLAESEGDFGEAEWRFAESSAGEPAATRQLAGKVEAAAGSEDLDLASRSVTVGRDDEHQRYELRIDGDLAARALYEQGTDHIVVTHTEVRTGLSGQGLGSVLAKGLLEDVRGRGLKVVPECPFLAEYVRRTRDDDMVLERQD